MLRNLTLLLIVTALTGCTSFRTTIMQRGADSRLYLNSPESKTRGIPVKLKVPTHVEVKIVEHFFIQEIEDNDGLVQYSEARVLRHDGRPIRTLEVLTAPKYTEKVFTVDFRRPAGGMLNISKIDMDDQQYFQTIAAEYEEKTLEQINSALGTLKDKLPGKKTEAAGGETDVPVGKTDLATRVRTVAVARFDISQPDWEAQLNDFVEQHVTACLPDCHFYKQN